MMRISFAFVCMMTIAATQRVARADPPPQVEYAEPVLLGNMQNPAIDESSGLAISRINPHIVWTHNDSGNPPVIYAVGPHGEDRAAFTLRGVRNRDWEDIASYTEDGQPWLIIGEIGDNGLTHRSYALLFVREPKVADTDVHRREMINVDRIIRFVYPDGAANCEALAVDTTTRQIVLIHKVLLGGAGVYTLPLPKANDPPARGIVTATPIGELWINMVTAADISPDGRRLIIGTYGPAYELTRGPTETWAATLKHDLRRINLPKRRQGEGLCYTTDGRSLLASSEQRPTPLWSIPAKK